MQFQPLTLVLHIISEVTKSGALVRRKFALRMGRLSETPQFILQDGILKKLISGALKIEDLTEEHLKLDVKQKGVDMRIGIDITSLALKKQVDQIVLIAGDSDFVPAAKLARREGIDFILDPLRQSIASDLFEHIDGLKSCFKADTPLVTKPS